MKKLIAASLLVLLTAACGSSQKQDQTDDGHYTQDDLERDTGDVYRPSNSGKDDDGVEKGSKKEKTHDNTTVEKKDEPKSEPENKKTDEPKHNPGDTVENPKKDPKKDPEPKADPKKEPEPKTDPKKEDDGQARMELMGQFIRNVNAKMDDLEKTKAWKDFLKAKEKFDDRCDKALEKGNDERGKSAEAAWTEAIQAWYEVRYMQLLFLHVNRKSGKDFEPGAGLNFDELQVYTNDQLNSDKCVQTTAAYELAEPEMKDVRKFQTDILKYDLVAGRVYQDDKQAKKWADEKQKWQDAAGGEFDDKDLKKYGE